MCCVIAKRPGTLNWELPSRLSGTFWDTGIQRTLLTIRARRSGDCAIWPCHSLMPRRFQSRLASEMEAFLRFKQGLGQCYRRGADTLRSFDRYVAEHQRRHGPLDWPALVSAWLSRRSMRKVNTVACESTALRQFCLFRRRFDPGAFVPDTLWNAPATRARFVPYDLSRAQVAELIRRTQELQDVPLRRSGMRALLSMLYCTGLRLGEAVRLRCTDVDFKEGCFLVRMSKGRSRWVPFGANLLKELETQPSPRI